jgi:hypothetical protein
LTHRRIIFACHHFLVSTNQLTTMTASAASPDSFSLLDLLRNKGLKQEICIVVDNARVPSKDMIEYALVNTNNESIKSSSNDFCFSSSSVTTSSTSLSNGTEFDMSISESCNSSTATVAGSSSVSTGNSSDFDLSMSISDLDTVRELRWEEEPKSPIEPQAHPVCPKRLLSPRPGPIKQIKRTNKPQPQQRNRLDSRLRMQSVLTFLPTDATSSTSQRLNSPEGDVAGLLDRAMLALGQTKIRDDLEVQTAIASIQRYK